MFSARKKSGLSIGTLLKVVHESFKKIKDHRSKKARISLAEALMSGLAVFGLKFPSLLKFDESRNDEVVRGNLKTLYGVEQAPCDTQLRKILDGVQPQELRGAYREVHERLRKKGVYEHYECLDGYHLVLLDGTGHYSSGSVSCGECCVKTLKNGQQQYYHQLLGAVLAHPDRKEVLPFCPEPITRADGGNKNDCEREASKRLLKKLKEDHPQLKAVVAEDSLSSNGPHVKLLIELDYRYVLGVKESDHRELFAQIQERLVQGRMEEFEQVDEQGIRRGFRFTNGVLLNKTHADTQVNYLDFWEIESNGKEQNFSWITDIELKRENVYEVMKIGRARWKVENETFNTLKNLGYQLEHNYGHGQQHLATIFGLLCMLAFLLDQVQELGCAWFQAARQRFRSKTSLWEKMRTLFTSFYIKSWELLWQAIAYGHRRYELQPIGHDRY